MTGWIWLALIVVGIVIEAISPQLVSIWFVFGFIGGLVANLLGAELWLQIVIALIIGVVSLLVTRPFIRRITKNDNESTNADRYIGMTGIVTEEIDPALGSGRVTVKGLSWAAVCDGASIPKDSRVIVDSIEGVRLRVHISN